MPKGKAEKTGMTVNKTISLPLSVVVKLATMSEAMELDFSTTLLRMCRIGIDVYEGQFRSDSELNRGKESKKEVNKGG